MHRLDEKLSDLIQTGKKQGYLTFTQVNDYLPDEDVNPEKLDHLLMSLEELGLQIRNVIDKNGPRTATNGLTHRNGKAKKKSKRIIWVMSYLRPSCPTACSMTRSRSSARMACGRQ